jgi:hypothetical protein
VHGHTPQGDGMPDFRGNRLNLDTGAVFGGALPRRRSTTRAAIHSATCRSLDRRQEFPLLVQAFRPLAAAICRGPGTADRPGAFRRIER